MPTRPYNIILYYDVSLYFVLVRIVLFCCLYIPELRVRERHIPTTGGFIYIMTLETKITPLHHPSPHLFHRRHNSSRFFSILSSENFTMHTDYNVKTHEYKHLGFFLYTYFNRKYFLIYKKLFYFFVVHVAAGAIPRPYG